MPDIRQCHIDDHRVHGDHENPGSAAASDHPGACMDLMFEAMALEADEALTLTRLHRLALHTRT
jgi:hypothetical protein